MKDTYIDFDVDKNRFLITTPYVYLDTVRKIPNRKWDPKIKKWTAPALRANAEYLEVTYKDAEWTRAARKACIVAKKPVLVKASNFPKTYTFKTKPFANQQEALDRVWGQKCYALFMVMGTGKSKIAIDLATAEYKDNRIAAALITCPSSIKTGWEEQIELHSPESVHIRLVNMDKNLPQIACDCGLFHWYIVAIETIRGSKRAKVWIEGLLDAVQIHMFVDESSKIKNPSAESSKFVAKVGQKAKCRTIMTGTEITQGIEDLYMQFQFLDPQIIGIGDPYSFRNRYTVTEEQIVGGQRFRHIVGYQNVDELMHILRPFVFQVTEKGADIPPKIYAPPRVVKMTPEQKTLYQGVEDQLRVEVENGVIDPQNCLERMLRLHQIAGGFFSLPIENPVTKKVTFQEQDIMTPAKNPKVQAVMEFVEEATGPGIVWCRYRRELRYVSESLRQKYGERSVVEFHGGVDEDGRKEARRLFQGGQARFFVGTISAGGMGITLTAAEWVIYVSNSFSLEDRLQSEDRAHRIGQTKHVTYVDIVAAATVDRQILLAIKQKKNLKDFVQEALKNRSLF